MVPALITVGGNPTVALPDQSRMLRSLDDLELSVCVDIALTPTARRAHYVLPAKHQLEREDVTEFRDMFFKVPDPLDQLARECPFAVGVARMRLAT